MDWGEQGHSTEGAGGCGLQFEEFEEKPEWELGKRLLGSGYGGTALSPPFTQFKSLYSLYFCI